MEIESTLEPKAERPSWVYWRMMVTVVLTAITAYVLSIFGYLPVNPFYATVMGSFIGVLFVLYESFYGRHIAKRWRSVNTPKEGAELK
ncbi:MAG: hypothetical protein ACXAEF_01135 [Candidatus Thorarchaeota archaeon]|jgi:hypothetical protein